MPTLNILFILETAAYKYNPSCLLFLQKLLVLIGYLMGDYRYYSNGYGAPGYGCPPQGQYCPPPGAAYPPQSYPPQGYPSSGYPVGYTAPYASTHHHHHSGYGGGGGGGIGGMLAGAAATAYGAHRLSPGGQPYGHGHYHGKFKHGKHYGGGFKHGGKFKKWK